MKTSFFCLILMLSINTCMGVQQNDKDLSFEQSQISVGSRPTAVQILDFNRDELADLAVSNWEDGTITVLRGGGKGQFELHSTLPAGRSPTDMAAGDFDEDGWTDLIVPNHGTDHVTILYGGNSGFELRNNSRVEVDVLPHPHSVEVADMNKDGHLDFIIDDHDRQALKLYFGQGNGYFPKSISINALGAGPYANFPVRDLNHDGNPDLVIPNPEASTIVLGNGTGKFSPPDRINADGLRSHNIAIADINGDGFPDIGAGSGGGGPFSVWFRDSDGKYRPDPGSPYSLVAGGTENISSTNVADVNSDGYEDFLVTSSRDKTLMILLGGARRLRPIHIEVEGNPRRVAAGDLNNDGLIDLATANTNTDEISVFLQQVM